MTRAELTLTVKVTDLLTADKEVREAFLKLQGKIIKAVYFENKTVLTAELQSRQFMRLIEKIGTIGELQDKNQLPAVRNGMVRLTVELSETSQ
jgi:hypothetical protein